MGARVLHLYFGVSNQGAFVGVSLLAMASFQSIEMLADMTLSRAGSLLQGASFDCPVQVDGETLFSRFIPLLCVSNLYPT
ncbi:hypothetical protein BK674_09675 [Pseudomonas moraviensis]|uniref:Uncharacterized protein n=2 Tax=Pseudomonas fluorescens group TaxID=136843 RepID=A0A423NRF0_9PSED|nr:hypothetical protein RU10_19085 [Pseudomonas fluorescens]ROO00820.1 hypothetical protein BK674_09675 [Pseudomonas moraviensis]